MSARCGRATGVKVMPASWARPMCLRARPRCEPAGHRFPLDCRKTGATYRRLTGDASPPAKIAVTLPRMSGEVTFTVLGPVGAEVDGRTVRIPGRRERAV